MQGASQGEDLDSALDAFREAVGSENVGRSDAVPGELGNATFDLDTEVVGMVEPADTQQVRECLQIASEHGIALYPTSRGKNWGYGHIPHAERGMILHLGRMDRILDFDESMGYVTLEPGVSYRKVYDYVSSRSDELIPPWHEGPKGASPIGNRLEGGQEILTRDHHNIPVTNFEVVLPSGEIFNTNRFQGSGVATPPVQSVTFGPDTQELFVQSNLGVVTKATFLLKRQPQDLRIIYFECETDQEVYGALDTLRQLKLEGRPGMYLIGNKYLKHAAEKDWEYPWDEIGETYPIPEKRVDEVQPGWMGSVTIHAPDATVGKAHGKAYKKRLAPHTSMIRHYGPGTQKLVDLLVGPSEALGVGDEMLTEAADAFVEMKKGRRGWKVKKLTWWRNRENPPEDPRKDGDPARDKCGLIWVPPVVPTRPNDIHRVIELIRDAALSYDFAPLITIRYLSERTLMIVQRYVYDRTREGAAEAAKTSAAQLLDALNEEGYFPYRYPANGLDKLPEPRDDWKAVIEKLKTTFDPEGILAPGRYDYRT